MSLDIKTALFKVIDEKGLVSLVVDDVLDGVIHAKLKELAAGTDTSVDDALVATVYPMLRQAAVDFLAAKLSELAPKPE